MSNSFSTEPGDESRKSAALVSFLGAGLNPLPSRAVLVSTLAAARRAVSIMRSRNEPFSEWLAEEARLRGVRENAAFLAVMEVAGERDAIADSYRQRYPQRADQLDGIVAWL
jgi:hypothetical protein